MSRILLTTALLAGFAGYLIGHWRPAEDTPADGSRLEPVSDVARVSHYVCPMHAGIVSEDPGRCPICGMDLVEQAVPELQQAAAGLPEVTITPAVEHNLGVRTAQVVRGDMQRSIETIGKITRIDPMARRTITPPIRGELVYIADKQQGDFVDAGELLFTVRSEELFEHEKAFQDAFRSGDRATASAMIPQLSDMGLGSDQIARLQAGEAPEMPVEVRAFEDGFVYTRRGRPGGKVHTGFTVFNVGGNYRVIEVTAEIFERQWNWVKEGQKARMVVRGLPGTVFEGQVVRVEPPVGYTTRSLEVGLRFRTDNAGLTQSMFAHVSIEGQSRRNVLMVPTDTVIRTGAGDRVVQVLGEGRFRPVPVVAGEEAGGRIEIRSGLRAGDRVVASGQFLIDSESNLLAGFRRLATPGTVPSGDAGEHHHAHAGTQQPDAAGQGLQGAHEHTPLKPASAQDDNGYQPVTYIPAQRRP